MKPIMFSLFNFTVTVNKKKEESVRSKEIKRRFMLACDGYDNYPGVCKHTSSLQMGVTDLNYEDDTNTLTVSLRYPGQLIGREGKLIKSIEELLECKIKIIETKLI